MNSYGMEGAKLNCVHVIIYACKPFSDALELKGNLPQTLLTVPQHQLMVQPSRLYLPVWNNYVMKQNKHLCICIHTYTCVLKTKTDKQTHTRVCMHTHTCTYMCTHTNLLHRHRHTQVYTDKQTDRQTDRHTHIMNGPPGMHCCHQRLWYWDLEWTQHMYSDAWVNPQYAGTLRNAPQQRSSVQPH